MIPEQMMAFNHGNQETGQPTLTMIVPVSEPRKQVFYECLESYRTQTRLGYELLIIDNGCAALNLPDDPKVRVHRFASNQGAASARNKGIELARGEWLLFVDADVRLESDTAAAMLEEFVRDAPDVLVARQTPTLHARNLASAYKQIYLHTFHSSIGRRIHFIDSSCMLMRKPLATAHGGFKHLGTLEDYELGIRVVQRGGTILFSESATITHLRTYGVLELLRTDMHRATMKTRLMKHYSLWKLGDAEPDIGPDNLPRRRALTEYRYGIPLAGLALTSFALAVVFRSSGMAGAAMVLTLAFYAVNARFLCRLHRATKGRLIGRAELLLPLDMLAAALGAAGGFIVSRVRNIPEAHSSPTLRV